MTSRCVVHALNTAHKLSSLLLGVMFFTNSSWWPTRSAKRTFFASDFGKADAELLACAAICITAQLSDFSQLYFESSFRQSVCCSSDKFGQMTSASEPYIENRTKFAATNDLHSLQVSTNFVEKKKKTEEYLFRARITQLARTEV